MERNLKAVMNYKETMMKNVGELVGIAFAHAGTGLLHELTTEEVNVMNTVVAMTKSTFDVMEEMAKTLDDQTDLLNSINEKLEKLDRINDTTEDIYKKIVQKKKSKDDSDSVLSFD